MRGLSLIETVIGVALFAFIATTIFATYQRVFVVARYAQARVDATAAANAQFEIIRNLPYAQVGTIGGIPAGVIPPVQTVISGGKTFISTTTVRNLDQPFDGTAGGAPDDLSPADNKLVEVELSCVSCPNFRPLIFTTSIAPLNLESASTDGSLFVRVIDSGGLPVPSANVRVYNGSSVPVVNINDSTTLTGMLQLVGAPPAVGSYEIAVSKTGYSSEQTYGAPTTTNPVKPHATVAIQAVTQLTFMIDRTATLDFSSVTPSCAVVPNVNFQLTGSKLIATTPNVFKYDMFSMTNGAGLKTLSGVEWDSYALIATSSAYDVAGIVPLTPIAIAPGATQNIQLVMVPKNPSSVVVTVKDVGTGLPVTGATVKLERGGASTTEVTGRGYLRQTDWSGGSGQSDIGDITMHASNDGNIDTSGLPGGVQLRESLGTYSPSGELTSSTFDTGAPANFYQFTFFPSTQPPDTGVNSALFHLATGNSTSSWNYIGPDGTASTFYTSTTTDVSPAHNGHRYLRYKMYLSTASSTLTPNISDAQFTFTSACVPPGQVIFQGLSNGTYNLTVTKTGYSTTVDTVVVNAGTPWQEKQVGMMP